MLSRNGSHISTHAAEIRTALARTQLGLKEFIQGLFLPLPAEPDRLAAFQVAHHRDELLLFPQMDFIHAHQLQRGLAPRCRPALQIAQIDGAHRAGRQSESPRHLPSRGALTRLAHGVLKPLAERSFARQLRHLLDLDPAIRAAHPIDLDHHRGPELHARQIPHLPLADIVRVLQLPAASRADQLPIAPLAPNPQLQRLRLLVDLVPVHPIPRPSQQFGEFVISQTAQCTEIAETTKLTPAWASSDSCAEPQFSFR